MKPELPDNLDRYFAAQESHDVEATVACFAPDATVHDEGQVHVGREAIRQWIIQTAAKFSFSVTPYAVHEEGDLTKVIAKVTGNFPGSPVDLTFSFGLTPDGLIRTLRIG